MKTAEEVLRNSRILVGAMNDIDAANGRATPSQIGPREVRATVAAAANAAVSMLKRGDAKAAAQCLGDALVMIEELL